MTGAQQDSGAVGTPTRSPHAEISMHDWTGLCAGGESGYTAPDPLHPEILFGGTVTRCNVVTGAAQNVSPERGGQGPFRHAWTQPLVFSQADPHALYFANQFLYKTTNGGESWTQISPDLTREDPGVPPNLDAAAAADAPQDKRRGVIYTIAPSPVRAPLDLDRHRRRLHPGHRGRRQDVAERDAARADAVEQGDDDRRVALRRERSVCRRGAASARGLRAVHLSHARRRQDVAEDHEGPARRASTCRP